MNAAGITVSKRRLAGSAFLIAFFYVLLIVFLFIIAVSTSSDWAAQLREDYASVLTLCLSLMLLYCIVYYYYYFEDRSFFAEAKNIALLFSVLTLSVIVCCLFGLLMDVFARPTALIAMLCVFLFKRRDSVFINFIFAMTMFVIDIYFSEYNAPDYESATYFTMMVCFVCNPFAVFVSGKTRTRGRFLLSGFIVALPTALVTLLLRIPAISEGWYPFLVPVALAVFGCVVSAVLALALLPVFEGLFNKLTSFRLRELTNTNAPILTRLREEAPGTFNHSMIVAQLSETCALALGENAELARAAGYYHDVGKIKQPDCFTENQTGYNVHNELMPELSADIIRSHAKDGYDLLVSAKLPKEIADIAREHHGTLPIKYFYDKAARLSGGDVNIADYSYPGPIPQTKIAAIVMIADAAEAATRAVANRSPEEIEKAVRSIIEERMDLGQFEECNITMRELTQLKQTLTEALSGVYHHRVEYPNIRFNRSKRTDAETGGDVNGEGEDEPTGGGR